jgi:hypothetical protein
LEGLAIENLGIFHDYWVYFTAIGNILWPFGKFCGHLIYFSPFWYFVPRKIWQPCSSAKKWGPCVFKCSSEELTRIARWNI